MSKLRNDAGFLSLFLCLLAILSPLLLTSACGGNSTSGGVNSHVLILVTDSGGQPVSGATVWVPADAAALVAGTSLPEGLALTDSEGNSCADPPEPALFAACTGSDGIALLQCGGKSTFLFKFQKDSNQNSATGTCGKGGVVAAPF